MEVKGLLEVTWSTPCSGHPEQVVQDHIQVRASLLLSVMAFPRGAAPAVFLPVTSEVLPGGSLLNFSYQMCSLR